MAVHGREQQDAGLLGVSCIAADNHLDDFMWYTLHNLVSAPPGRKLFFSRG